MTYDKMPTDPQGIKELEAEHLTEKQGLASEHRERVMRGNERRTGLSGAIVRVETKEPTEADPTYRDVFVGEIAGHKVEITSRGIMRQDGNQSAREREGVSVTVWGTGENRDKKIELPQEEAEGLWMKLGLTALITEEEIQSDISKISVEREKFLFDKIFGEVKKDFGI